MKAIFSAIVLAAAVAAGAAMPDAVNAHGGWWLEDGGRTYWYGEHKVEGTLGNTAQVGVHVYSSANLRDWTDESIALAVEERGDIERGCVLERPKVLKCGATGKYVMLFHLERKGLAYNDARVGFAVADSPAGPFRFVKSVRPNAGEWPQNGNPADETPEAIERSIREEAAIKGNGPNGGGKDKLIYPAHFADGQQCRDMTVFVDPADGKAYHIFASERNSTIHIAELADDYLDYTGRWWRACEKDWTEAPCVWKHGEWYFMLGSGCTGWKPNEARYYRAKSITGPWERMGDPCVGTTNTWGGQSAFVFGDIAVFDMWCPTNAIAGTYLFKKITYPKDGEISIDTDWQAEIDSIAARGGGTLVIPPGEHFTGALFFKPGVKLHLEKGAILKGSPEDAAYPVMRTRFEGREIDYPAALVNAIGCDGFEITGEGVIDGNGEGWWLRFWERRKKDGLALNIDNPRPRLVQIAKSKGVRLSGTTFKNSAAWTVHIWDCDNICVEDCTFLAETTTDGVRGPSTDGLDLDGVRGAVVRRCCFDVNDDAVAVKGGKGEGSHLLANRDILVEDCDFEGLCHSAMTLGSECPFADGVTMRNCRVNIAGNLLHEKYRWDTQQVYTNIIVEGVTGKWGKEHHVSRYYGAADRVSDECRAKAWWFFGQTETTREGITADAEAFKRAGFGGVVYYDQYHGENPAADRLWSDEWWDGIEFAATEAARLGLSFETAVGNGYVAGGPWIDPAHGMKRLDAIDRDTNGGKVRLSLPVAKKRGWQKTVAVLAIPLDGRSGEFIDLEYAGHEKGLASTMQHPGGMYGYKAKMFKPVANSLDKIRYWQAKAGLVVDFLEQYGDADVGVKSVTPAADIIDLTDKFREEDERLECELPEGRWKILRLVCVPTGARTKHGRPDAMGLECDKMSRDAVRLHWRNYTLPIIRRLRAKGLPLKGIIMDSHEAGAQNWTDDFPVEFKARRGYDLRPFLPVMAGYAVDSQEASERVLADVSKTCVELIAERYYGEFNRLCEAESLTFTAQTGGGMFMLGDSVFTKKYVQIPESEFWGYQEFGAYDVKDCSSAAHLYGKPISSSEALTDTPYRMKLEELRRRTDLAFAFGANAMTVCAVPHMPLADAGVKAKTGPREYGINRTNPWWESSRPFWDYIAFCSWMLRQGKPAPEALWFAGDRIPSKIIAAEVPSALDGLDWDFATRDAASRLVKTPDAWTTPEGVRYPYVIDSNGRTLAGAPPSTRIPLPHISRRLASGEILTFIANNTDGAVTLEERNIVAIDPWTRRECMSVDGFTINPGESVFIVTEGKEKWKLNVHCS